MNINERILPEKESNFIDVLQRFPNKMNIQYAKNKQINYLSLRFSNAIVKISENNKSEKILFKWKSFLFEIDRKNLQDIKFVYHKSEPGLNSLKLTLRDNYRVEFEEANPMTKKQENKFFRCFPRSFSNEGFWKIEVLAKDLNDVKLDSSIASYEDPYKAIYRLLKKWSELKSFSHWLCFPIDSKFIEDILRLFPKNWKFNVKIVCRYIDDFKEFRSYLDDISKLNIKELIIDFENSNIILDEVIFSLLDLKNLKKN